ncbi:MAG: hypothetical protein NTU98_11845 [Bacteroidetes bacterium]|nr:hypothetical protein [Bacteroidota bacterium]
MLNKDSFGFGLGIGLAGPLILLGIIFLVRLMVGHFAMDKALFVCVALNIVPIRYYFITAKMDRTGRGVLFMTAVLIVLVTIIHI